jgi:hypothetical protein
MKRVIAAAVFVLSIMNSAGVASASAGSIGETTTTTTTTTVLVEVAPVPIKSGTGRRIVYANRQQRVWVINEKN